MSREEEKISFSDGGGEYISFLDQNIDPWPVVKLEGGPSASMKPGQKSCVRSSGIITFVSTTA
jgi:hypothetical protein